MDFIYGKALQKLNPIQYQVSSIGVQKNNIFIHDMARLKVDLHNIYNNSKAIDKALLQAFEDAIDKKIKEVEIIPGKGSGQLRKKVERFLQLPHIKPLYHRIENDSKNFGRLFVYFKF